MSESKTGRSNMIHLGLPNGSGERASRRSLPKRRAGITVVEVLVSMVVAIIGVLGIMIMIPFSVGQVQTAFDYEMSNRLARNMAQEFKIKGFDNTDRWRRQLTIGVTEGVSTATARTYLVDPIGAGARVASAQATGHFPFVHPNLMAVIAVRAQAAYPTATVASADKAIVIERVSLEPRVAGNALMTQGLARTHFSWRHQVNIQTPTRDDIAGATDRYPTVDLAPPQQIFDVNSAGLPMRRQMLGEMSCVVLTVPSSIVPSPAGYPVDAQAPGRTPEIGNADRVIGFRNFVLVYKQRPMPVDSLDPLLPAPYDRIYEAIHPMENNVAANPMLRVAMSGGTIQLWALNPDFSELDDSNNLSTQRADIRRGDWMALTNVVYHGALDRFVQDIDFLQVLDATYNASTLQWTVTLQGPSFDFKLAQRFNNISGQWELDQTIDPDSFPHFAPQFVPGPPTITVPSRTYAIHLPDVWAVVERTYE